MQLFIDFIDPNGTYRAADAPSFLSERMPAWVLVAGAFLEASGQWEQASRCRVYHLERGAFVEVDQLGDVGASDLDTIVIVNCDDDHDAAAVDAKWYTAKGLRRALAYRGVPHAQQRACLSVRQ